MPRGNLLLAMAVLLSISWTSLASAAGLQVAPNSFIVNFTEGSNATITFTITNEDTRAFYNVSVQTSPSIRMDAVPVILPGTNVTVSATVLAPTTGNQNLRIRGFYNASVGLPSQTFHVNLTPYEANPCDLTVTRGDKVVWRSFILSETMMINAANNLPIDGATLHHNQSYDRLFNEAGAFQYYLSIGGYEFPHTCTVTILDDVGIVNDPQLDAILSLTAFSNLNPTTISISAPVTNYSLQFFETQDGVITLTNTGSFTARNIRLESPWFTFTRNNFDLDPAKTAAIAYTITPAKTVKHTNQTNQTYAQTLTVTGNFPTVQQVFSIGIAHALINSNETDIDRARRALAEICRDFPDSIICKQEPQVVYRTVANGSDRSISFNVTEQQLRTFFLTSIEQKEILETQANFQKEQLDQFNQRLATLEERDNSTSGKLDVFIDQQDQANDGIVLFVIIIGGTCMAGFFTFFIYTRRKQIQEGSLERWH